MRITISGPPGSGKTTIANSLAREYNLEVITGGLIFRRYAKSLGINLEELGKMAEKDPKIDLELDRYLLEEMRNKDNIIVESRLAGWLAYKNGIPAFKIFITADEETRVQRIIGSMRTREGESSSDVLKAMRTREKSEYERYKKYYGADYNDLTIYDLIIDSTDLTTEQVLKVIKDALDIRQKTV